MPESKRSRATKTRSQRSAEARLIELLERRVEELEKANAKLLRMVELGWDSKFYRPDVTGSARENQIAPGLPIELLNDVETYDAEGDAVESGKQHTAYVELEKELREVEAEHNEWRAEKGLADEETIAAVPV